MRWLRSGVHFRNGSANQKRGQPWILPESSNLQLVQQVLSVGYADDLDDVEIEEIGKDPFLVAAALSGPDRVVVTREFSKKTRVRERSRLPDVCEKFGVRCVNDVKAYALLNFTLSA